MKKILMALATFVTLSAFANEGQVNAKVLHAFKTEFVYASQVEWTVEPNYYKATFDLNGQRVFAFYSKGGALMGLARNISSAQLPVDLQVDLKKEYGSFWISDLFEVSNNEGTAYYITLENADTKLILKSDDGGDWSQYRKIRKV